MKNIFLLLFIFILNGILFVAEAQENAYKVIKVIDGDTVYIDFNNNGIPDKDEKVRLNGIDTFETKPTVYLEAQMEKYNLTQDEALGLGYYGEKFAKKELLNKYVIAKYTGETKRCNMGRHLMSIYYDDGKNYEEEILKAGLDVIYAKSNLATGLRKYENLNKVKQNALKTHKLNLALESTICHLPRPSKE